MNPYLDHRGNPWDYDPGPPKNLSWSRLFSETPNFRQLGKSLLGFEKFRWHFGPIYYRGRLRPNSVKVLIIGQEGAQDESLSHRSFTGGTGSRMQNFLNYLGITDSYLFVNTFVYPIFGQYDNNATFKWLSQDPASPVVKHRHAIFDYILNKNDVRLIVAVGNAAKESLVSWVQSRGGQCPSGITDVSICQGQFLDPKTRIIGVIHPGSAQGGNVAAVKADFIAAINKIKTWVNADSNWLPVDPGATRDFSVEFKYRSAPIPLKDFPFGIPLRLGRGGTSSNRKDSQRAIQLFSAAGKYNNSGVSLKYSDLALGTPEGYQDEGGDVPYEPPIGSYMDYDKGPGEFARLFSGMKSGYEWPDFNTMGVNFHASFGMGPVYRGRPYNSHVLIFAEQQSHDDMFTFRALTGDSGQRMQVFLNAIGITQSYTIIRVLPIDTLDLTAAQVNTIINHPQVQKVYQQIIDRIMGVNPSLKLVLSFGSQSSLLLNQLNLHQSSLVELKNWKDSNSLNDWKAALQTISGLAYNKDNPNPSFNYHGQRGQIPRIDLPYGTPRWYGSSGDRSRRPTEVQSGMPSSDYFKILLPDWVFNLDPLPLSSQETNAISNAP